jgi:hypothetical protein
MIKVWKSCSMVLLALVLMSVWSCSNDPKQNGETKAADNNAKAGQDSLEANQPKAIYKANPALNDLARIIGGVSGGNQFTEIQNYATFQNYAKDIEKRFASFESRMLSKFGKWSSEELKDLGDNTKNLFYPFSGPDIAYAFTLFPDAENYFMLGLEPVGAAPNLANKSEAEVDEILKSVSYSVRDNMNYSFFITKNMKTDFSSELVKGTIPVLLFYMANLGHEIVDLKYVKLNSSGEIETTTQQDAGAGVRISFVRSGKETQLQHVYYFSKDISNANGGFMELLTTYCSNLTNVSTLVKSSSYCMHEEKFSTIRGIILDHTDALIQDDTGVPFKFFNDAEKWDIRLYGKYTSPISIFASKAQADFRESMKSAKPIDFKFGYNTPSNITVARRRQ